MKRYRLLLGLCGVLVVVLVGCAPDATNDPGYYIVKHQQGFLLDSAHAVDSARVFMATGGCPAISGRPTVGTVLVPAYPAKYQAYDCSALPRDSTHRLVEAYTQRAAAWSPSAHLLAGHFDYEIDDVQSCDPDGWAHLTLPPAPYGHEVGVHFWDGSQDDYRDWIEPGQTEYWYYDPPPCTWSSSLAVTFVPGDGDTQPEGAPPSPTGGSGPTDATPPPPPPISLDSCFIATDVTSFNGHTVSVLAFKGMRDSMNAILADSHPTGEDNQRRELTFDIWEKPDGTLVFLRWTPAATDDNCQSGNGVHDPAPWGSGEAWVLVADGHTHPYVNGETAVCKGVAGQVDYKRFGGGDSFDWASTYANRFNGASPPVPQYTVSPRTIARLDPNTPNNAHSWFMNPNVYTKEVGTKCPKPTRVF